MAHSTTVLQQMLRHIPRGEFESIVRRHGGNRRVRKFSCWNQFTCLLFGQLTGQQSLRDLTEALGSKARRLYHLGLRLVKRSTLAETNERRDHRIYAELFERLYQRTMRAAPRHGFSFPNKLYSLDASVIDLCLSMFRWARFRTRKGAIKLHTLLDHDGGIPSLVRITEGAVHEIQIARTLRLEPDSIVTFDRAYIDFHWLHQLHNAGVYFVTRLKRNTCYRVVARRAVDRASGVTSDQTIRLTGSKKDCLPIELRRIRFVNAKDGKAYVFLTNHFGLCAATVAEIYKARWDIELFFKWIKQNLKLKTFLGTSKNAVMTQVWIALIAYLLLSYLKFLSRSPITLRTMRIRLSLNLLSYVSLATLLHNHDKPPPNTTSRQLTLDLGATFL